MFVIFACSAESTSPITPSRGGSTSKGGASSSGGSLVNHGGTPGGVSAGAGGTSAGGSSPLGGSSFGGSPVGQTGGMTHGGGGSGPGAGGRFGAGGSGNGGGGRASGGSGGRASGGAGGASSPSGGAPALDCNATMPTNGTKHTGDGRGGKDNLAWELWANTPQNGSITTFSTPSFEADWNNAGDFLARIGYEWGNSGKTYDTYGTISAQLAYKKTGSGGGYSYIGIYGWSTNPCVEWYIVDDSYNGMPVNPGNTTNKGTVNIDGGDYIMYTRQTTGTGGSRCSGVSNWAQYYSIRKTGRQCGTISITKHFDAWKAASMPLGNLLEAKILVEVGGGQGSVQFPVANVMVAPK
jgi:endo-1,4-beta-xylanase